MDAPKSFIPDDEQTAVANLPKTFIADGANPVAFQNRTGLDDNLAQQLGQTRLLPNNQYKESTPLFRPPDENVFLNPVGGQPLLIKHPDTIPEGLANSIAKGTTQQKSPLAAALGPISKIPGAAPIIAGLFAGLGAKGVGATLGELSGTPNLSSGQIAEGIGDATQSGLMMLPAPLMGLERRSPVDVAGLQDAMTKRQVAPVIEQPSTFIADENLQHSQTGRIVPPVETAVNPVLPKNDVSTGLKGSPSDAMSQTVPFGLADRASVLRAIKEAGMTTPAQDAELASLEQQSKQNNSYAAFEALAQENGTSLPVKEPNAQVVQTASEGTPRGGIVGTSRETPSETVVSGDETPSIGKGVKTAVEKNQESASFGLHVLDPEVWKELGFKLGAKIDATQLANRLRNKLGEGSSTWETVKDLLPKSGMTTVEEVQKKLGEGLKAEMVSYGMEGKVSEAKKEYDKMTHEWYDRLDAQTKQSVGRYTREHAKDPNSADTESWLLEIKDKLPENSSNKEWLSKLNRYAQLNHIVANEPRDTSPRATLAYETVSPFDTHEPMPDWTTSKSKRNVQRVDVVVPYKEYTKAEADYAINEGMDIYGEPQNKAADKRVGVLWQPDNLHENLPNTLGWAMIQYKTGAKGEKIAVIAEAQSRWGQHMREYAKEGNSTTNPGHPFLKDYNRLILKAVIEQARKEGATHIVMSDAETAMMTEGHDAHGTSSIILPTKENVELAKSKLDEAKKLTRNDAYRKTVEALANGKEHDATAYDEDVRDSGFTTIERISQEPGMRLNYDKVLPKIAEELTGSKGERVSLGEHKNAFETKLEQPSTFNIATGEGKAKQPRKNLIFRNPDGTSKTDASGLMYRLNKAKEDMSLLGKDKVKSDTVQKGIGQGIQDAVKKNQESGTVNLAPIKDSLDKLDDFRKKLVTAVRSRTERADIVRWKDAADSQAMVTGQRARKGLEGIAKNVFGSEWEKALDATTAAIEANGDAKKLDQFITQAIAGGDTKALEAAQYAKANWEKIQPLVQRVDSLHLGELSMENTVGIPTDFREGYIRHMYDLTKIPAHLADRFFSSQNGTSGRGFLKGRVFETYYDAIAAGYGKAIKTLNAGELLESRIASGQRSVNDVHWLEGMKSITDPTTKQPIVTQLVQRGKDMVAPTGYETWSPFAGKTFAVHKGYKRLLNNMTATSAIREAEMLGVPVGELSLKGVAKLKHSLLMYDTYHAMRMSAKGISIKGSASYSKGVTLLEYDDADLATAVKNGDITQAMADYAKKERPVAEYLIAQGLNVGRIQEALHTSNANDIISGWFAPKNANRWIFEKLTRGVMMESAVVEFKRLKGKGVSNAEASRQVVKDVNVYFGNLGRQGLFRNATLQDMSRFVFLAPQWFESMARTELGSAAQFGKALGTGQIGTLAKGTGTLLAAMFVATQLANLAFQKKFTWQNEEGHKLDAKVPGGENGFWVSPLSLPMELSHDVARYMNDGKNARQAAMQVLRNKYAPLFRAEETVRTGRDYADRKLDEGQVWKSAAQNLIPLPLPVQAGLNPKASVQRQLMASAGLKAEPAKSPTQRMQQLAVKYKEKAGIKLGENGESEYSALTTALRSNDAQTARKALTELRKVKAPAFAGDAKAVDTSVYDYYASFGRRPFIGGRHEDLFKKSLDEADKATYDKAVQDNQKVQQNFFNIFKNGQQPKQLRQQKQRQPRYNDRKLLPSGS